MSRKERRFPDRLHVLMASSGDLGLAFRRGPSRWVVTLLWDRSKDEFGLGQWHHGRIYERRSDLSPDGQYLLYFAADARSFETWTAISRAPFLKPLDLYTGSGAYEGGGLFVSATGYMLRTVWAGRPRTVTSSLLRDDSTGPEIQGTGNRQVYFAGLRRDGWHFLPGETSILEKTLSDGWKLRKYLCEDYKGKCRGRGHGPEWDEHDLIRAQLGVCIYGRDWERADVDNSSVVWATKRCIYGALIRNDRELEKPVTVHDFNSYAFE